METADFHASFPLACGGVADLSAAAACGDVLALLRESHRMSAAPGDRPLARITPLTDPAQGSVVAGSGRLRADFPADRPAELYLRDLPRTLPARAAVARNILFLALLPLLRSGKMYFFHGGLAVDRHGYGCIICGPSGVGKSTAVTKAGKIWEILADDLLYLSFADGKCFAQPGPTWSAYTSGKEKVVECDVNRVVEVKNTVILTRVGELGLKPVRGYMADLMLANSFVEMTGWLALCLNDPAAAAELKKAAFPGVMQLTRATRCQLLTSELATDIAPWLETLEEP